MRRTVTILVLAIALATAAGLAAGITSCGSSESAVTEKQPQPSLPFSKGVNFSTWFEAPSPSAIFFTRFSEQDFINVKSMGADVIRLPINLHAMTGGPPSYTLDPLFLDLLDQAVGWAEKHEIHLILDNHSFDPVAPTDPGIDAVLIPVWTQMAGRYRDRSGYILYEVLNEPHGIDGKKWAAIQDNVIKAIREIDPERFIIIGGVNYNSIDSLYGLPVHTDNIIYTFHFYDPYLFTHQGETWGSPPNLKSLKGMPFPANAHAIPAVPAELKGTWVENSIRSSYRTEATAQALAKNLDKAAQFSRSRGGLPLFCGEFGVYIPNSLNEDRVRWYRAATGLLDERGIARTSWDYYGGFGLFKTENGGSFESDLNVEVAEAMGFTAPPQKPAEKIRDGFTVFDIYPDPIVARIDRWSCDLDLYGQDGGKQVMSWGNAAQYGSMLFSFKGDIDWEYLKSQGYAVTFSAKTDKNARFDVRFIDREGDSAIPWRMNYTVDIPADGQWHNIRIPLASMTEHGAWVNASQQWLNPQGKFSWADIATLSFVAEENDLLGITVSLDSIKLER